MAKNKKLKSGYIHGIYVTAKTKEEFKNNKNDFNLEGIKSAYSLQKQKNIATKALKIEREAKRDAIRKAYGKDASKFSEIGYSVEVFLEAFQKIEDYNQKLEKAMKKGRILKDTPRLSFPIEKDSGRIMIKRLTNQLNKTKVSIREIRKKQYDKFFNNVKLIYGEEIYRIAVKALKNVPINTIYKIFDEDIYLSPLVYYDISSFDDEGQENFKDDLERHVQHFLDLVEEARKEAE